MLSCALRFCKRRSGYRIVAACLLHVLSVFLFVFVLTTLVNSDYAASINIIHEKFIRKERSGCGLIQVLQQHLQTNTNSLGHNMVISLF
jgi:hypothetical protein